MRLYGEFSKVTENDDGTLTVSGIASSECVDADGETITAEAMRRALPGYFKFPAVREMHQSLAAGTGLAAEVDDEGRTHFECKVVDPVAVQKVKAKVYRGFSIGGRVPPGGRNKKNPKVIEQIELFEVSLVDRPANPEAAIQLWKASAGTDDAPKSTAGGDATEKLAGVVSGLVAKLEAASARASAAEGRLAKVQAERDGAVSKLAAAEKAAAEFKALAAQKGFLKVFPVSKVDDVRGAPADEPDPKTPEEAATLELKKVHRAGGVRWGG